MNANRTYTGLIFIFLCIGLAVYFNPRVTHTGVVRVVDGDSLNVNGREIRLYGIDAPEYNQTCGQNVKCGRDAMRHLAGLINGREVVCEEKTIDRYKRSVSVCKVEGVDIGASMVRDGFAVSYGGYFSEEAEAKANKRQLWNMEFELPSDYRARNRK
jgi:endonuclease YncB( thermonuclease family)